MSPPRSDDARDGRDRESEAFRLEPESERDEKVLDPPGTGTRGPGTPRFAPYEPEAGSKRSRRDRDEGSDGEKKEISTATVRERRDPDSRSVPGPLPEPRGWPREALTYPLRGTGVVTLAIAAAVLGLADVLTVANAWLGAMTKGILLLAVFSFQVRAVAATATGSDRLPRFAQGADFEPEALKELLFFAIRLFLYLVPALFLWLRPILETPQAPVRGPGQWLAISALAAAALALAPILLLSTALRYRGLSWPWRAFPWLARGLVPCLTVGAGWAVLVVAEIVVASTSLAAFLPGWLAYTALRFVVLWFLMVGARGLGVLGRHFPL